MNIFEVFQMVGQNVWLYGGSFILILSLLVFVHEWGHYIIARLCGVKVEAFSIGFGKEIFGFDDKNGTRWKFSLIPLGGYVKLFGDTDPASAGSTDEVAEGDEKPRPMTEAERQQAFFAKPVWQRAAVVFAGPAINYIFAILILTGLFVFNGQPVTPPSAAAVVLGSSANENGFEPHDVVVSIGGKKVNDFADIRREMMIALDTPREFVVARNGETFEVTASPKKITVEDRFGFPHSKGVLGLISPRNAVDISNITNVDGLSFEKNDIEGVAAAIAKRFGTTFPITMPLGDEEQVLLIHPIAENNENLGKIETNEANVLVLTNGQASTFAKFPVHTAFMEALKESWVITRGTVEALGQMIVGTRSATELGGVIRIGALAGDMAQQGLIALILFTALLSINLGFINLLPIPLLDGGHLLFYFFEALRGKPVPEPIQEYAFRAGFVFLIALMVFANLNDIMQLFL
ncbi:MAG: RIP metalloprotease RseP [Bdellovibrionales bacterium]